MTSLDVQALRARAGRIALPSLATVLVVLVSLIPFALGFWVNALWQGVRLVVAAFAQGWDTGEARMGPKRGS